MPEDLAFLFTDIQGSTRLLRELGIAYGGVLNDVRTVLRAEIERAGGREVDCSGDELFAVFPDGARAVDAALGAQRALLRRPWPDGAQVRVRMGVHVGRAHREGDGYVGLDVHQAARICSAGHGGQIVLSQAAAEAAGTETRDLGAYALDGIPAAQRLHQVVAPDLPTEFPPLRSARRTDVAPTRVVLADDSVLLREGVALLLEEAGMAVVAQTGNADDLLVHVEAHRPDVAIVDIRMPPGHGDDGLRAAGRIRGRYPEVGVLLLSQYAEPAYASELVAPGPEGVGYLLKDRVSDVDEFAAAVRRVATGGTALDPSLAEQLVAAVPLDGLDDAERDVLLLVGEGRTSEEIAERLFVTVRAVEERIARVAAAIGVEPAREAVLRRLTSP